MLRSRLRFLPVRQPPVRISSGRVCSAAGIHRVTVPVAGEELWFESHDLSLTDSIEAIGSAFVIPAAAARRRSVFESPPDAVWLNNAQRALKLAEEWWGYRGPTLVASAAQALTSKSANRKTALCFTCGVDSFYSLLHGRQPVDQLLFVYGYDIPLADTRRAQAAETSLRSVAGALGLRAVLVRTNLRTHGDFCAANWEHAHGGALAAVGHLLSDHLDQLLISASYPRVFDRPWGSHSTRAGRPRT